jgi:tRNA/rRNA methyltransferase/tRNA (cytidine32/uridine32-2'-O)-methyltransferase
LRSRDILHDARALDNVVVVLDHPQDVVNIAGVIRAMMNMGLSRLRLVRPADFDAYRIEGIAHRSDEVIRATRVFETLDEALSDAAFVVGTTARPRTAQRNFVHPREGGREIVARAREGLVAVLFGREDKGLSNEALDRCHSVVLIPTVPAFWSINLAQACLIVLYEVFLAAGADLSPLPTGRRTRLQSTVGGHLSPATGKAARSSQPATQEDLESMFAALENGLSRIDFFKSRRPAMVMRTLRTVLARARLDLRESRLLRAIGFEIGHFLERGRRPPADPS